MTQPTLHAAPRIRDVVREQVRAVALALRTPAIAAVSLMTIGTLLTIGEFVSSGGAVDFAPELSMLPGIIGLLFPIGVWKGEDRFGASLLWTLPVDRRSHALAKVCGGWVCLMAAVALFLAWLFVLSLITGGNILGEQVLSVLPSSTVPAPGTLDPAALRAVRYRPQLLLWLVPFTAATGAYLLASAVALGSRHPIRWVIGIFLGALLLSALGSAASVEWLKFGPANFVRFVHEGRFGFDALLTARAESLKTVAVLSNGKTVNVWRDLPDVGEWAIATLAWTSAGCLALWAAVSRHRERRRPAR
jgi:hypothetical protein